MSISLSMTRAPRPHPRKQVVGGCHSVALGVPVITQLAAPHCDIDNVAGTTGSFCAGADSQFKRRARVMAARPDW